MRLPTGSIICLPRTSASATEVYVTKANIDWGSEALFAKFAERHRDFLDIGAHIGYYSAYLAPIVRRAYAFEPDPRNLPALRVNASLAGNIDIVEMAVSSRSGRGRLHTGAGSAVSSLEPNGSATIDVATTTVDAFLELHPKIDVCLIKTDIEGYDFEALSGMCQTVARFHPLILTECKDSLKLRKLCADWDYAIFGFTRDNDRLKTTFRELSISGQSLGYRYKMLFLVPNHLTKFFSARSET